MHSRHAQELDGQSALEWMAEQPELPDLVLLDCMMPGMDGAHNFELFCYHPP